MQESYIAIGKIAGPVGLDGRLKATAYSEIPERFLQLDSFYVETDMGIQGFVLDNVEVNNRGLVLKIKHIDTRMDAESLTGKEILVDYDERLEPPDDMFYVHDLIGCEVMENEKKIGVLKEVMTGAGNDVYVVVDERNREILIPVVEQFVRNIDIVKKKICVSLIDGMRPEDED